MSQELTDNEKRAFSNAGRYLELLKERLRLSIEKERYIEAANWQTQIAGFERAVTFFETALERPMAEKPDHTHVWYWEEKGPHDEITGVSCAVCGQEKNLIEIIQTLNIHLQG